MNGWTCPQCATNYSPSVLRCPCTSKLNQEPPKQKSVLDGMPVSDQAFPLCKGKEDGLKSDNKEHK